MPSSRPSLAAAHRDITGKAVAHLRKAGKLPAVVITVSTNVTIDAHDFEQLRRKRPNTLIDLAVDGRANPVLISDVQLHRHPAVAPATSCPMTEG
jgi:ribosomal protein L25 (general stress protein Ctc)